MIESEYRPLGTLFALIVGVAWIANADASADPVSLRVVALSEQQAPGTSNDTRFVNFDHPVINNSGQTAFRAAVASSGSTTGQSGLWFEGGGRLNMAALRGAEPNVNFSDLRFAFNDQAKFVFQAAGGIWAATSAGLSPIVKDGDAVPGYPGHTFSLSPIWRPTMNKDGTVAFADTPDCDSCGYYGGVWTVSNGALSLAAPKYGAYPGPDGIDYYQGGGTPKINAAGQVSLTDGSGVWTNNRGGQFEKIMRSGGQAPGLAPGVIFGGASQLVMNNARGDVVFQTNLQTPGVYDIYDDSIWRFRDGNLHLALRHGDHAPGFSDGVVFDRISLAGTGDSGDIAVFANLSGPGLDGNTTWSIWRVHDESLQLVAQPGMQAPGFAPGVTFSSVDSPAMNDHGQVAFRAFLNGTDPVYGASPVGIFGEDVNGKLRALVRYDEPIDVDLGSNVDERAIKDLVFNAGNFDGSAACNYCRGQNDQQYAFNDLGQVAFAAQLRGSGFGVFVTSPLLVPEPTSGSLLVVAGCLLPILSSYRQRNRARGVSTRCR